VNFTGLSSAMAPSFSFAIFSASVWFEHEVAIDDYPHRKTRPDCQSRLDVEIAPNDLLTGLVHGIPCPTAKGLQNGAVSVASIRAGTKFGSYTKQSRQQRRLEQLAPVMIDLVVKQAELTSSARLKSGARADDAVVGGRVRPAKGARSCHQNECLRIASSKWGCSLKSSIH
jgi:hypothetical protein